MGVRVSWRGEGLTFAGTADTGIELSLASSLDEGKSGFKPMELLGISLAGCTAMDVLSILEKMRQVVTDFEVRVRTQTADEHPRVWTWVQIEYLVTGKGVDPKAVEKAINLSAERYCPIQNMIDKVVDIDLTYKIIEA
jgi:putative redox protein